MTGKETVRADVSEAYTRALDHQAPAAGCCGPVQKGVAAKVAGYQAEQLGELPPDAVSNSFGCGDPVAFSGVREGDVVLDLGCGAGIDILLAAKKVGPTGRVIGVDMTDAMLEKARTNIEASGLTNVEVRRGIIEELPVADGSVDWLISNCVINLSPDKPRVFTEIARVLKPGGRMLVSDIVVQDLPEWVRENKALYQSCVAGAISEADYLAGLGRAGLTDAMVQDRIEYDASQIAAIIESDVLNGDRACGTLGRVTQDGIHAMAESLQGKVQSVRIAARKPG
ncbi:MAG: arsenite methyltransferase [Phycisphaerae bacterium]